MGKFLVCCAAVSLGGHIKNDGFQGDGITKGGTEFP